METNTQDTESPKGLKLTNYPASIAAWVLEIVGRGIEGLPRHRPAIDRRYGGTQWQGSVDGDGAGIRLQVYRDENERSLLEARHRIASQKASDAQLNQNSMVRGLGLARAECQKLPFEDRARLTAHIEQLEGKLEAQKIEVAALNTGVELIASELAEWKGYQERFLAFETMTDDPITVSQGEFAVETVPVESAFHIIAASVRESPFWYSRVRSLFAGKTATERPELTEDEILAAIRLALGGPRSEEFQALVIDVLAGHVQEENTTDADLRVPADHQANGQPGDSSADANNPPAGGDPVHGAGPKPGGPPDGAALGQPEGSMGGAVETNPQQLQGGNNPVEKLGPSPQRQRVDKVSGKPNGRAGSKRKVNARPAKKRGA